MKDSKDDLESELGVIDLGAGFSGLIRGEFNVDEKLVADAGRGGPNVDERKELGRDASSVRSVIMLRMRGWKV